MVLHLLTPTHSVVTATIQETDGEQPVNDRAAVGGNLPFLKKLTYVLRYHWKPFVYACCLTSCLALLGHGTMDLYPTFLVTQRDLNIHHGSLGQGSCYTRGDCFDPAHETHPSIDMDDRLGLLDAGLLTILCIAICSQQCRHVSRYAADGYLIGEYSDHDFQVSRRNNFWRSFRSIRTQDTSYDRSRFNVWVYNRYGI